MFSVIAAIGQQGQLGLDGALPWPTLTQDRRWFQALTTAANPFTMARAICADADLSRHWHTESNAVIMGRRTWESLRGPLPKRQHIVVTNHELGVDTIAWPAGSLADAISCAETALHAPQTWVIGGAQLYAEALAHPDCRRLFLTEVDYHDEADTWFPAAVQFTGVPTVLAGDTRWACTHTGLWIYEPGKPTYRLGIWEKSRES